jgi:hypothetical protein
MPRFFFDIDTEQADRIGLVLPNRKAARAEAIVAAGGILRDIGGTFRGQEWTMRVRNATGEQVWKLRFSVKDGGQFQPRAENAATAKSPTRSLMP